jgi:stage III sporulation protein AG
MNEQIKNLKEILKKPKILIILGIIGILLIFLSSLGGDDKKVDTTEAETSFSTEEYKENLEKEVEALVKKISGSKKAQVIITLEGGIRYSYAESTEDTTSNKNESSGAFSSSELKRSFITVKTSSGGESALLISEYMPDIRGVAIVCAGGDDEEIREKVQNAVMAALNITSKRVYVTGGRVYENQ